MSNQSEKQASIREITGTISTYEGDWHALFDDAGIATGDFNGRLLAWINNYLTASYTEINSAMAAFAQDQGFDSWDSMGEFQAGGVDIVFFLGQSNADGREEIANLPASVETFYNTDHENLNCYYKPAVRTGSTVTVGSFADDGVWYKLSDIHDDGTTKTHQVIGFAASTVPAETDALFGPALSYGKEYFENNPSGELYILKAGLGNSSIDTQWDVENAISTSLYYWFKTYIYDPAIADILASGKTIGSIKIFWMQGEQDTTNSTLANQYAAQLRLLMDRFNTELALTPQIAIMGLSSTYDGGDGDMVKAAQATVASEYSNVLLLPTDGTGIYEEYDLRPADLSHYAGTGYVAMMADFYKLFKAPYLTAEPSISGTNTIGETLTASAGTWLYNPTITYQWQKGGVNISGATASTHEITEAGTYTCDFTATNSYGAYTRTSSNSIVVSAAFVPTDNPNVVLFLTSTAGVLDTSGEVDTWEDQSATGADFTSTGTNRPTTGTRTINSDNVLDFVTNKYMTLGAKTIGTTGLFCNASQSFTVFVAAKTDTTGNLFARAHGTASLRTFQLAIDTDPKVAITLRGTTSTVSTPFVSGTESIYIIRWDGGTLTAEAYLDGGSPIALSVGAAAVNTGENILIGARTSTAPAFFLDGAIRTIVVADAALSVADMNDIGQYINTDTGFPWTDI